MGLEKLNMINWAEESKFVYYAPIFDELITLGKPPPDETARLTAEWSDDKGKELFSLDLFYIGEL